MRRLAVLTLLGGLVTLSLLGAACRKSGGDVARETPERERLDEAKRFVDLLAAGDFAAAVRSFDETMATALPEQKLAEVWASLNAQAGRYVEQTGVRAAQEGGYQVVFVTCRFERTVLDAKIVFGEAKRIAGLFFVPPQPVSDLGPPGYDAPGEYRNAEVVVGPDEASLPGTLSLPARPGSLPAVVLVHGSGPLDRDETIGPNKPFRDLAVGLASRGIAVLRYDKRTFARAAAVSALGDRLTLDQETVDDAVAAVRLLRSTQGVDPGRVFVLGHSLGGIALPRVAAREPGVAGFVLLAVPSRPLEEVYRAQIAYLASLDGTVSADERGSLEALDRQVARVRDSAALAAARPEDLPLGLSAAYWSDLKRETAQEAAASLRGRPVLILQGGRDYQSTEEDLAGWRALFQGSEGAVLRLYPDLNHLLMEGRGPITPAEYEAPGHVSAQVVADLADWIRGTRT
jgi:alpha-beta hydrolase superfamily lysophospholipase